MNTRETELFDHSDLSRRLLHDLEAFIDEIGARGCTTHLEEITTDGKYAKGKQLGQKPERFIEDYLIFPVLRTLGHSLIARPVQYAPRWSHGRGIPDFALTTVPTDQAKDSHVRVFGESKSPNKLHYAREDVKEYLNKDLDFHAVAILTDGIEWELWVRHRRQAMVDENMPYKTASLQSVLTDIKRRNIERESYYPHESRKKLDTEEFVEFTDTAILKIMKTEFDIDTTLF